MPLEVLVNALVRSLLLPEARQGGRRMSMQMHARLFTDPDETASVVRADIYDETNALYVTAIQRALPKLPAEVLQPRDRRESCGRISSTFTTRALLSAGRSAARNSNGIVQTDD